MILSILSVCCHTHIFTTPARAHTQHATRHTIPTPHNQTPNTAHSRTTRHAPCPTHHPPNHTQGDAPRATNTNTFQLGIFVILFYQHLHTGYDGTLDVKSGELFVKVDGCDITFITGSNSMDTVSVSIFMSPLPFFWCELGTIKNAF